MLQRLKALAWETFHIFFRHFNFPCELRLIKIGNPTPDSFVFLSGNYTLTVQRLIRKLGKLDCYLLVANSRGSNVWCAAGMNEFTEYDVIDAINVSDLKNVVRHRRIIAPVYAAPGVNIREVKEQTGFNIKWGPTHLDDIPRYIENNFNRTNDMLHVKFGMADRLEQAVSTAWCYAMTLSVGLFIRPRFSLKAMGLIFLTYLFGFTTYPILPDERNWRRTSYTAAVLMSAMTAYGVRQKWSAKEFAAWESVLAGIVLLMAMDQCGSTPLHKSTIAHWMKNGNYESHFSPVIDPDLCINCGQCILVCPKDVFAARRVNEKTVVAVNPSECEECLACFKQCPTDAIFNRSGQVKGDVKSIPNLEELAGRDWSHLKGEDRWIGAPTTLRAGIPVVIEDPVLRVVEPLSAVPAAASAEV